MARRPLFAKAVSSLAAILILAAGCSEQNPTSVQLDPSSSLAPLGTTISPTRATSPFDAAIYSATIGTEGGKIKFGIGEIEFPAGAVSSHTKITATVNGSTMSVEFQPHGLQFPADAAPVLSFDAKKGGVTTQGAAIFYVDDSFRVLETLTTFTDIGGNSISAQVRHFSRYVMAAP